MWTGGEAWRQAAKGQCWGAGGGQSQETGDRNLSSRGGWWYCPLSFPTGQAAAVKSLSATASRCRGDQATLLAEGG